MKHRPFIKPNVKMKEKLIEIFKDKKTICYEILTVRGNRRVGYFKEENATDELALSEFQKDIDRLDAGEYLVKMYRNTMPATKSIDINYSVLPEPKQKPTTIKTEETMSADMLKVLLDQNTNQVELKFLMKQIIENQEKAQAETAKVKEDTTKLKEAINAIIEAMNNDDDASNDVGLKGFLNSEAGVEAVKQGMPFVLNLINKKP
jgi:hypothetical protein